jgi:hypothetical protein
MAFLRVVLALVLFSVALLLVSACQQSGTLFLFLSSFPFQFLFIFYPLYCKKTSTSSALICTHGVCYPFSCLVMQSIWFLLFILYSYFPKQKGTSSPSNQQFLKYTSVSSTKRKRFSLTSPPLLPMTRMPSRLTWLSRCWASQPHSL